MPPTHRPLTLQALRLVLEAAAKGYGYTQQTVVLTKAGRVAEVKGLGQEVQFPSPDLAAIVTGRACGTGAAELRAAAERVVAPQSTAAAAAQVRAFSLNPSQAAAAVAGATRTLTLVQGPPGTGKTKTAIAILLAWVRSGRGTILAASDSNIAVDNLLEALASHGVPNPKPNPNPNQAPRGGG